MSRQDGPPREPPAAVEAERAALGAVILKPSVLPELALDLRPADFWVPAHRAVFEAMVAIDERKSPVDVVALSDELKTRGVLSRLEGGPLFLSDLARGVPTAENVSHYVGLVRRAAAFRAAIELGARITALGYAADGDPMSLVEAAGRGLVDLTARRRSGFIRIGERLGPVMEAIEERMEGSGLGPGIATGFWQWDELTVGLQPQTMNIIAARPSIGKSSLLRCVAVNAAKEGAHVLVFSLEESSDQMVEKWAVGETNVDNRNVRRGRMTDDEWRAMHRAATGLYGLPIYIDDADGRENNIDRMRLKVRAYRAAHPRVKLVVGLDYIQLAEPGDGDRNENRTQAVAAVSRGFKALCKETETVGVALAQIGREVEKQNREPSPADLRESGSLEQDADSIAFIHADMDAPTPAKLAELGEVKVILAKNRGGPTGSFKLRWVARQGRFENVDPKPIEAQAAIPGM